MSKQNYARGDSWHEKNTIFKIAFVLCLFQLQVERVTNAISKRKTIHNLSTINRNRKRCLIKYTLRVCASMRRCDIGSWMDFAHKQAMPKFKGSSQPRAAKKQPFFCSLNNFHLATDWLCNQKRRPICLRQNVRRKCGCKEELQVSFILFKTSFLFKKKKLVQKPPPMHLSIAKEHCMIHYVQFDGME